MTTPKNGCSFQPVKKVRSWRDMPVPPDGANSEQTPVQAFAETAQFVLANMDSFDIWTFVNLLKGRNHIGFAAIQQIYRRWCKEQSAQGRIQLIPSCYDNDVWRVV